MRLLTSVLCGLALSLFLGSGVAWGDSIAIVNPSFENGVSLPLGNSCGTGCSFNVGFIPGWIATGPGETGLFAPSSTYFNLPLPNGNILAYTNDGTISQTLTGTSLLPDSTYTLSVDVGQRLTGEVANYSVSLDAGSGVLCSTPLASNGTIAPGTFHDVVLTCTTGATVPSGFLGITLAGTGTQIDFDNVQLNVASAVSTPEPSALVLMLTGVGIMGLLFARSGRNRFLQGASS